MHPRETEWKRVQFHSRRCSAAVSPVPETPRATVGDLQAVRRFAEAENRRLQCKCVSGANDGEPLKNLMNKKISVFNVCC